MRIPTREEFSPLPEVVDRFGLPDPTAILPELENQLGVVAESQAQVDSVVAGLRGIAEDLDGHAAAVSWEGVAGDRFRARNVEITRALRNSADDIAAARDELTSIDQDTRDLIKKILFAIGSVATIVGGIVTIIVGSTVAGVIAIIAGVVFLIGTLIDEFLWLIQQTWEGIQWVCGKIEQLVNEAGEWIGDLIPGEPSGTPSPRPQAPPTPPSSL